MKKEHATIRGIVTVKTYKAGTCAKAQPYFDLATWMRNLGRMDLFDAALKKAEKIMARGYLSTPVVQENLVMQAANLGNDIIIQRLCAINTYSLNILYGEIGTSNTAPTSSDTGLNTSAARTGTSFAQDYGNTQANLQFFFSDALLLNTTYYEFGTFVDGVLGTPGSGQMFNHALFASPYVKTAGNDTTVQQSFIIS